MFSEIFRLRGFQAELSRLSSRSRYNAAFQSSIFEPPSEQLQSTFVPAGRTMCLPSDYLLTSNMEYVTLVSELSWCSLLSCLHIDPCGLPHIRQAEGSDDSRDFRQLRREGQLQKNAHLLVFACCSEFVQFVGFICQIC